jgi:hypothetical protein
MLSHLIETGGLGKMGVGRERNGEIDEWRRLFVRTCLYLSVGWIYFWLGLHCARLAILSFSSLLVRCKQSVHMKKCL